MKCYNDSCDTAQCENKPTFNAVPPSGPRQRPMHGGPRNSEHLRQIADGLLARRVHAAKLLLLLLGQLGLLAPQLALGPRNRHSLRRAHPD